ncbi:MAG: hypothetical protein KIT43_14835 [Bauldia sp.]|nr:hypothetical protein [Bauldia sp.]
MTSAVGLVQGGRPGGVADALADLGRARRRAIVLRLVTASFVAVASGLAVFCILQVAYAVLGKPDWIGAPGLAAPDAFERVVGDAGARHAMAGLILAVAVFAGLAVLAIRRSPSLILLARRADRTFGNKERLSTALELRAAGHLGPVGQALMSDIEARPSSISVRRLVPFSLPPAAFAAIALLVAALVIVATGLGRPDVAVVTEASATVLDADEREEIAENVRRIAALINADATARNDPFLAAVARELEQVGQAVAADAAMDRGDIAAALERLRSHAAAAYQAAGVAEGAPTDLTRLVEAAIREIQAPAAAAAAPAGDFAPPAGTPSAPQAAGPGETLPERAGAGEVDLPLGEMLAALEEDRQLPPQGFGVAATAAGEVDVPQYDDIAAQGAPAPGQPGQAEVEVELAGMVPAGAAANAGAEEGDAVGGGTRDLEDGTVTEFGDPLAMAGEMLLADAEQGDGRRIRLDAPPDAMALALAAGEATDGGGWVRLVEHEISRPSLPPELRRILQAYFGATVAATP